MVWEKTEVIVPGDGVNYPRNGDTVHVYYTGKLEENGKVFDSNVGKKPLVFVVGAGGLIKGWEEGILQVSLNEKCILRIEADDGYGDSGVEGHIPPNATLLFEMEVVQIEHVFLTEEEQTLRDASFLPDGYLNTDKKTKKKAGSTKSKKKKGSKKKKK